MTSQRWQQIKDLLDRALEQAPSERESLVRDASGDDCELRDEVLSLLASHDEARDFLEPEPPSPDTQPSLAGVRVGAWELVREIGRGGMGSVYLAVRADQEFQKRVAIKLIRGGKHDEAAVMRFRHERQILARLEHPNIARLIDGGTTAEGFPYFVMEYVEGESYLSYCRSRDLPLERRIAIFQFVCAAVEYAHRRNIVHRDLKPSNILVKADGTPKLLDFGIAKLVDRESGPDPDATLTGFPMMTPAYASPEQLRGEPVTRRSDIYALGAVLWEALTGELPRGEASVAFYDPGAKGVAKEDCAALARVAKVIRGAMRENPADRYDSVQKFADDLRNALAGVGSALDAPGNSIAVLPFQCLAADGAEPFLGAAMADAVIIRLSNLGRIVVRPTSAVMRFPPTTDATTAGRQLNVRFVAEGLVQKIGVRIRVTVQLISVETGSPVCAVSFDEPAGDLLRLEDSISAQVAQALVPQLTGEERRELARQGTKSAKAHQAYLRGRWHWSRHSEEAMPQVLLHFTEAVVEDPQYARAHAGIADYHIALGMRGLLPPKEAFAAAVQSARQAIALDPRLAEAHASLGLALWAGSHDYEGAEHHLQMAITLHPDYAPAHDWFGLLKLARGKPELALASIERARALEPSNPVFAADLAMCHYGMRRYAEALRCFAEAAGPLPVVSGSTLTLALLASGERERAIEAAREYLAVMNRAPIALGVMALAECASGNQREAHALLEELAARARDYYVSGLALALANVACGRMGTAIRQLRRAVAEGDWWTMYLRFMPVWDPVRGQAGFARLLKRAEARPAGRRPLRRALLAAAAVVLAVFAVWLYLRLSIAGPPLRNAGIARLTTEGIAEAAALSPDGRYLAWSSRNGGQVAVSVRKLDSSEVRRVAGPFEGILDSLVFTRDGKDVAFVIRPVNDPAGAALHIVPAAGGPPRAVIAGVPSPLAVASDEGRAAFYRSNGDADELVIARMDAARGRLAEEHAVYSRPHPDAFAEHVAPAWSPDGRSLACVVQNASAGGHGLQLLMVDIDGRARRVDTISWQKIAGVVWSPTGSGLLIAGEEAQAGFQQVWWAPARGGRTVRITNDLADYASLSLAGDESALAAVQAQTIANLYLFDPRRSGGPRQITPGGGRYSDVAWTPDGRIVYASDSTGAANIWMMDATGTAQHQLTHGPGRNYAPAVSPDGRTIAFHSNRDGVWNIWRIDADGGDAARVTHDATESTWPRFTRLGDAVVYQHLGINALYSIRRQMLSGGAPEQLTTAHTMFPTMSEDGRLAYWYCQNPTDARWSIAILNPGAAAPDRFFSFPPDRMPRELLRWVPGQNAISYVENRQGVSNIWIQPLDGSPARPATSFTSGHIYSFDWSRDGRLVYSQGTTASDVVLLRKK